jgi:hypothetical protein
VIRHIASRVTGTAISTGRFAVGIPLGVARTVLSHVPFVGGSHGDDTPAATSTSTADAVSDNVPHVRVAEQATAQTKPATAPPAQEPRTARTAGTPKSGEPGHAHDDGPEVVLTIDTPPEEIEPPVDVVGEALQAEQQQVEPPAEVDDEHPVVYSTSSDDR